MLGVSLHHLAEHHIGRSVVSLEDALPQVEGDTLGPDGDPWQVAHGAAPWPGSRPSGSAQVFIGWDNPRARLGDLLGHLGHGRYHRMPGRKLDRNVRHLSLWKITTPSPFAARGETIENRRKLRDSRNLCGTIT